MCFLAVSGDHSERGSGQDHLRPPPARRTLALAVLVFCLRALQDEEQWKRAEPWVRIGFWGLNAGIGLMVALDLFPSGVLQLWDCLKNGYWHARSLEFLMTGTFHKLEWARSVADGIFLLLGVFPLVFAALLSVYQIMGQPPKPLEAESRNT